MIMLKFTGNLKGFISGNTTIEAVLARKGYRLLGMGKGSDGKDMREWRRGEVVHKVRDLEDGERGVYGNGGVLR